MAENDIDKLADAIIQKMKEGHHAVWLDPETHASQHEFLRMMMDERAERIARRKRIEEKIAGSVILSAIVVIVGLIGAGALNYLRDNLK